MARSEATTAVPSQNVSNTDLAAGEKEEVHTQPVVAEAQSGNTSDEEQEKETQPVVREAHSSASSDPPMKTEEFTAIEEAEALDKMHATEEEKMEYPRGPKLAVISLALCLSVFLVALVSIGMSYHRGRGLILVCRITQSLLPPFPE